MGAEQQLEVTGMERWQIYQRLQELEISCRCNSYGALFVNYSDAIAIAQVWSVARHVRMQRSELTQWLEQCWKRSR
jgi:predicted DNA-binding transcriptional regulator AlpA